METLSDAKGANNRYGSPSTTIFTGPKQATTNHALQLDGVSTKNSFSDQV